MKKKIIEFFYPNLTFFRSLWRSLRPSWCFLRVYYWLKYYYGSFSQSSSDAKHVRIGLKNKKKFCWKKKIFIEISDSNLTFPTESIWEKFTACQLWVSEKIFWDLKSKIRFHSFVGLDLEHRLSTHNMVISLELKAIKTQKWKKSKSLTWVHFWNNRLQVLTKYWYWCLCR